jgi:hypothetical protein
MCVVAITCTWKRVTAVPIREIDRAPLAGTIRET